MENFIQHYRFKIAAVMLVIIAIFAVYGGYNWFYIPSPRHSMSMIEQAIRDGDAETFSDMVDSSRVSASVFDALAAHASWQADSAQPILRLALGPLKGDFTANGKTYLEGRIAGDTDSPAYTAAKNTLDARLKAFGFPTSLDGWTFISSSHYANTDDNTAQADLTFHNDQLDADVTCTVTMERLDSKRWHIVGVTNTDDFFSQVDAAYAKKLAAYNKPIQDKIDGAAKITDVDTQLIHDSKANTPRSYLRIHYTLQYTGNANAIKGVRVIYELRKKDGNQLLYRANTVLPPSRSGATEHLSQFLLNPIIPSQYALTQMENLDQTTSTIKLIAIYFTDGTNWQVAEKLPQN